MAQLNQLIAAQSNVIHSFACIGLSCSGAPIPHTSIANVGDGAWPTANKAIYIPFRVYEKFTAKRIVLRNGVTLSGNVDVGIYNSAGTRLVSSGSVAQAGVSADQIFDITDTDLVAGLHYMAVALDNTTGQLSRANSFQTGPTNFWLGVHEQATAFALPATATFADGTLSYLPIMILLNY